MSRGDGELLAHSQPNAYTFSVNEFMAQNTQKSRKPKPIASDTAATHQGTPIGAEEKR